MTTTDDLAAEIAAHRQYVPGLPIPGSDRCEACWEPWPCFVARLATEMAAILEAGNALASALEVLTLDHLLEHDCASDDQDDLPEVAQGALDTWRSLVPAEGGEDIEHG